MECKSVRFSCDLEAAGNRGNPTEGPTTCSWNIVCCDGNETTIELNPNEFKVYCVKSDPLPVKEYIQRNSITGEWDTKDIECFTRCGDGDPRALVGYEYYEYENCNNASQKVIFRGDINYNWQPTVAYNGICWHNGVSTTNSSSLDIRGIMVFSDCLDCATFLTPTVAPVAPPPTDPEIPSLCLIGNNELNVTDPVELLSGTTIPRFYIIGARYGVYNVNTGVYNIEGVPERWPIAFLNNGVENLISYTGTKLEKRGTGLDGNTYDFYSGTITLVVNNNFNSISYQTLYPENTNGDYMGGLNNLRFSTECDTPSFVPTVAPSTPTPAPTSVVPPIPSPVKTEWTLSYSQSAQGWPSFYSYIPEYMIGMNNYFYTFNGGNLFQHNVNELRNNYYGAQYHSSITTVFNQNPLENKIFKTLNLESDNAWEAYLETDIQINGYMRDSWFVKKEGSYFAYLRQEGKVPALEGQYATRSANGIGKTSNVEITEGTTTLSFSTNPLVSIGSIISVGDYIYHSLPSYTELNYGGVVTQINVDLQSGINKLIVSTTSEGTVTFPLNDPYIMFIKSSEAESHGLLGHYCIFTITNFNTQATELFAVESDVMKSYP
jgi:hypothetical protein